MFKGSFEMSQKKLCSEVSLNRMGIPEKNSLVLFSFYLMTTRDTPPEKIINDPVLRNQIFSVQIPISCLVGHGRPLVAGVSQAYEGTSQMHLSGTQAPQRPRDTSSRPHARAELSWCNTQSAVWACSVFSHIPLTPILYMQ